MGFKITDLQPKKLVGKSLTMSFIKDKTGMLWESFAPQMATISNRIGGGENFITVLQ